jgi:hypothetical protein
MKNMGSIEKRLDEIEIKSKNGLSYILNYASRAAATAQILSGIRLKGPEVYEIGWNNESLADDAMKLRWLRQYKKEQLDEFRQEWVTSSYERDKIALNELDRLMPMLGGGPAS